MENRRRQGRNTGAERGVIEMDLWTKWSRTRRDGIYSLTILFNMSTPSPPSKRVKFDEADTVQSATSSETVAATGAPTTDAQSADKQDTTDDGHYTFDNETGLFAAIKHTLGVRASNEQEVGITEYADSTVPAFAGIIKHRSAWHTHQSSLNCPDRAPRSSHMASCTDSPIFWFTRSGWTVKSYVSKTSKAPQRRSVSHKQRSQSSSPPPPRHQKRQAKSMVQSRHRSQQSRKV